VAVALADSSWGRYHPPTSWLAVLGTPLGIEVQPAVGTPPALRSTVRVCFSDLRRIDFALITESFALSVPDWSSRQFADGHRVLFSRSAAVDQALRATTPPSAPPVVSDEQFEKMAGQFWLKAPLAVTKAMRYDHLIGLHLALDLARDCLVLAMMLRDRSTGVNRHRVGGPHNEIVAQLGAASPSWTAPAILIAIEQSGRLFHKLGMEWSSAYRDGLPTFRVFIEAARSELARRATQA
jgi:hypothetical protein